MECSLYVKLQVSQDIPVSFINCYQHKHFILLQLTVADPKRLHTTDCNSLGIKYLHTFREAKKNNFFKFALMEGTEDQSKQSPCADSFYHVHIFKYMQSEFNGTCTWTKLK